MSLATSIGREMNVFCEAEGQAHRLSFKSPILLYSDFKQLTTMKEEHYRADTLDITFDVTKTTLEATVKELCDKAEKMVRSGTVLLVLSDRNIAKDRLPVPAPMAVGAMQTRLVESKPALRCQHHRRNRQRPRSAPLRRVAGLRRDGYLSIPCL
ncbi:glutamate synthase central domain-containing protein [Escherichia coli]